MEDVLGEAGIRLAEVDVVANCQLQAVYVQPAELDIARAGNYTIDGWIDGQRTAGCW